MLALVLGSAAAGFTRGVRWAWWLAVTIFTINCIGDIFAYFENWDLVRSGSGILIAAIFLVVLLSRTVKGFFEHYLE